jgi:hypothetical protein
VATAFDLLGYEFAGEVGYEVDFQADFGSPERFRADYRYGTVCTTVTGSWEVDHGRNHEWILDRFRCSLCPSTKGRGIAAVAGAGEEAVGIHVPDRAEVELKAEAHR